METPVRPLLHEDAGIRFGLAHAVLVVVLLLAGAFRLGLLETEAAAVLAMGCSAATLPALLRPVLGSITWAFLTGFSVNGLGVLTFRHSDVLRLGVIVTLVVLVGELRPRRRTGRSVENSADWWS